MQLLSEFITDYQYKQLTSTKKDNKIWNKFDKKGNNILNTEKFLPKLLYTFIWLFIKKNNMYFNSNDDNIKLPKYKQYKDISQYYSNIIIKMMPISEQKSLTKYHFEYNIAEYFDKLVEYRSTSKQQQCSSTLKTKSL